MGGKKEEITGFYRNHVKLNLVHLASEMMMMMQPYRSNVSVRRVLMLPPCAGNCLLAAVETSGCYRLPAVASSWLQTRMHLPNGAITAASSGLSCLTLRRMYAPPGYRRTPMWRLRSQTARRWKCSGYATLLQKIKTCVFTPFLTRFHPLLRTSTDFPGRRLRAWQAITPLRSPRRTDGPLPCCGYKKMMHSAINGRNAAVCRYFFLQGPLCDFSGAPVA